MFIRWHIPSTQLIVAALILLVASWGVAAEEPDTSSAGPTFHSDVSEVRVTFVATDENDHPLTTLTRSDFAIVDNGRVVREFRSFTRAEETSLDLVALVDSSESVAMQFRTAVTDLVRLATLEEATPQDELSLLSFGSSAGGLRPAVLCSNCRSSDSANRLAAVKASGTTPLFDSLIFAASFITQHRRESSRPVLILFSDGNDTISLHSAREALQAVLSTGALIYSVDMGKPGDSNTGSTFLQQLSENTGALYFSSRFVKKNGAATVMRGILEDLRASYVVTYELPSRYAGFHELRLLPTHNLNLRFHSRRGYVYEPNPR